MPQKAYERWFCHVMAFAFYFEMPQNRRISFSVPFLFQNWSRAFFEMPHFPIFRIRKEKWDISKKHVINFKTEKGPNMKFFDFGTFQNKMQIAITWQNHHSRAFWGISYYFPSILNFLNWANHPVTFGYISNR